jgi:hypothetical protein
MYYQVKERITGEIIAAGIENQQYRSLMATYILRRKRSNWNNCVLPSGRTLVPTRVYVFGLIYKPRVDIFRTSHGFIVNRSPSTNSSKIKSVSILTRHRAQLRRRQQSRKQLKTTAGKPAVLIYHRPAYNSPHELRTNPQTRQPHDGMVH